MSCRDCDDMQKTGAKAYYRWKNANVEMVGCPKHLLEIFDVLREAQKLMAEEEVKYAPCPVCGKEGEDITFAHIRDCSKKL